MARTPSSPVSSFVVSAALLVLTLLGLTGAAAGEGALRTWAPAVPLPAPSGAQTGPPSHRIYTPLVLLNQPADVHLCSTAADCDPLDYCRLAGCAAPGRCVWRPDICLAVYDPVCGCDSHTYDNACSAASHGMSIANLGECQ